MEVDKEWNAMSSWGVYDSPWRGGGSMWEQCCIVVMMWLWKERDDWANANFSQIDQQAWRMLRNVQSWFRSRELLAKRIVIQ